MKERERKGKENKRLLHLTRYISRQLLRCPIWTQNYRLHHLGLPAHLQAYHLFFTGKLMVLQVIHIYVCVCVCVCVGGCLCWSSDYEVQKRTVTIFYILVTVIILLFCIVIKATIVLTHGDNSLRASSVVSGEWVVGMPWKWDDGFICTFIYLLSEFQNPCSINYIYIYLYYYN